MNPRIIAHFDMDAFFASVEERDNPRFVGKPIVVGADPKGGMGRGVVSTANYKAREYGIRSALPISTAWRLAENARRRGNPPAIFLGVNMRRYAEASSHVMAILRSHAEHIEEASVDEAYVDLSFTKSYENARKLCEEIKREIKTKEKLTASVGIGPNKLIAKISSDKKKPDGLTLVTEEEAEIFLAPLPIRTIPGVGPKAEMRFRAMGIATVGEAKKLSREVLIDTMGKWGVELYNRLRADDDAPIVESWEVKSIGEQETFEVDSNDANFLRERLNEIAREVHGRFKESNFKSFRGITITVRFADFITKTRASTLKEPTNKFDTLQFEALRLLLPFLDARENPKRKAIRLLGVRIEKLL